MSPLLKHKTMQHSSGTAIHCIRHDFSGSFKVTLSDDGLKDSQEGQLEHEHLPDLLYLYARASSLCKQAAYRTHKAAENHLHR